MTAKHDENATTWRDLADQLTAEQIARFERAEQLCIAGAHLVFPHNDRSEMLADLLAGVLIEARWEAQQNSRAPGSRRPNRYRPVLVAGRVVDWQSEVAIRVDRRKSVSPF